MRAPAAGGVRSSFEPTAATTGDGESPAAVVEHYHDQLLDAVLGALQTHTAGQTASNDEYEMFLIQVRARAPRLRCAGAC